jgi:predicted dinucleotide-binding enzyme
VGELIERLGFFGIDLGALNIGARFVQFPGPAAGAESRQVRLSDSA